MLRIVIPKTVDWVRIFAKKYEVLSLYIITNIQFWRPYKGTIFNVVPILITRSKKVKVVKNLNFNPKKDVTLCNSGKLSDILVDLFLWPVDTKSIVLPSKNCLQSYRNGLIGFIYSYNVVKFQQNVNICWPWFRRSWRDIIFIFGAYYAHYFVAWQQTWKADLYWNQNY